MEFYWKYHGLLFDDGGTLLICMDVGGLYCKRRLYHMNESQREAKENALITILIHEQN